MKTHVMFLRIGEKDLEAAKYLLDKKLYPQSVFLMQQSVEKAMKSIGFWNNAIDETRAAKEIGHRALKVVPELQKVFSESHKTLMPLLETLKNSGWIERSQIDGLSARLDLMGKELSTSMSELQGLLSNEDEKLALSISLSKDVLRTFISFIDREREELNNLKRERLAEPRIGEQEKRRFSERFPTEFFASPDDVSQSREKAKSLSSEEIKKLLDRRLREHAEAAEAEFRFGFSLASLIVLNTVFSRPHATIPRYASYAGGSVNPLELYNEKMALVQMLPSFMEVAEETYAMLEDIYASEIR